MSLITELLEIQYLEENETSYRDRKMFEDRAEVKDSASDTFQLHDFEKTTKPL